MTALTNADRTAQTARTVDAFHAGDGRAQLSAGVAMTGLRAGRWHRAEWGRNPRRRRYGHHWKFITDRENP